MPHSSAAPGTRSLVKTEWLIAVAAVAISVAGFAQPQVLALAGLSFERPATLAARELDTTPLGSIARPEIRQKAEQRRSDAIVHGLAGTLRALRSRD